MTAKADTPTNVADLIKLFTTTGGGTTTQTSAESTSITPEAIQAAIQKALEGNSGLAAISSGQKGAGVYNSTVQTQLVNDLMTRAASEALAKSSTKTATTTKVDSGTKGALASPTALGSLAAIQALSKDGGVMSILDKLRKTADTAKVAASAADLTAAATSSDYVSSINDGASFGDYLFSSDVAGTTSAAADTASTAMDSYDAGVTAADAMGTASDSGGFVDTVTDWYDNAKDWVSSWW